MKLSALSLLAIASAAFAAPVRVLLPADPSPAGAELTSSLKVNGVELTVTGGPPTPAQLAGTDVLVLFSTEPTPLPAEAGAAIAKFTQRGGGLIILGGGIGAGDWLKPLAGGTWSAGSRKFANKLMFYPVTDVHPVTQNASAFDIDDETGYDLDLDPRIKILASAFTPKVTAKRIDPRSPERLDRANVYDLQPQMWAFEGSDKHRAITLLQARADS
ncbi:MAG TPA: ThuA domain-containing protein, partial [Verrucomicrobiales bacterium]|nr:ThuA domain-containing protein [Verrucomicrobiales bacterium]